MSTPDLIEPIERFASRFFDVLTDIVKGEASNLRDGTEHRPVELPRDLYAHSGAQTEWWYYTGHLQTSAGKRLGFELVFFKRRTDLDRFGVVPLRLIANPLYLAHFAVTDEDRGEFTYEHRKSGAGIFELPVRADEDRYYLRLGNWKIRERGTQHVLFATLGDDLILDLALESTKPPALNGHEGNGVSFKDSGEASRYFSLTRMSATGKITWHGKTEDVVGQAWMDREFGTWRSGENIRGWDWFSLQLGDRTDIIVYHIRDSSGNPTAFSSGTHVDADGNQNHLGLDDFEISILNYWTSPHSGTRYPSKWRIRVPRLNLDVLVTPVLENQELDTRGTTMIIYWEGACNVKGYLSGIAVDGRAYVELVGYDRSHESPSISEFVFGTSLERRWRSIFG